MIAMIRIALALPAVLIVLGASTEFARAQTSRTWVSAAGNDNNSCSRDAPCRTFSRAHDRTAAGGDIAVLDEGNFGAVKITKSISINGIGSATPQVLVTVLAPVEDPAIVIEAKPDDVVSLRGLVIEGLGVGNAGVQFNSGASLHIQNCVIQNFRHAVAPFGVRFEPHSESQLYLSDSVISGNGSEGGGGVLVRPAPQPGATRQAVAGFAKVVMNRLEVQKGTVGVDVRSAASNKSPTAHHTGDVDILIRDTLVAGNRDAGIRADATSGSAIRMVIDRSAIANNSSDGEFFFDPSTGFRSGRIGVHALGAQAKVRLANTAISGNDVGLRSEKGSVLDHAQNNTIAGNDVNIEEPPDNPP